MTTEINKAEVRANARWIISRKDLPDTRIEATYIITRENSEQRRVTLSKRNRQVLEALLKGPIHCASPVRLSDVVHILREDYGVSIHTEFFNEGEGDDAVTFGIYSLIDDVSLDTSDEPEAA